MAHESTGEAFLASLFKFWGENLNSGQDYSSELEQPGWDVPFGSRGCPCREYVRSDCRHHGSLMELGKSIVGNSIDPGDPLGEATSDELEAPPLVASTGAESPRTTPVASPSGESLIPGTSSAAFRRAEANLMTGCAAGTVVIAWTGISPWVAWVAIVAYFVTAAAWALYGLGLRTGEHG